MADNRGDGTCDSKKKKKNQFGRRVIGLDIIVRGKSETS